MNQDSVTVNRIDWLKVLPFLNLLCALRLAWRVRVLVPALLIVTLAPFGWNQFSSSDPQMPSDYGEVSNFGDVPVIAEMFSAATDILCPERDVPVWDSLVTLLCGAFALTVFGTAISRATATEFCEHRRTGALAATNFSLRRMTASLLSTALATGIVALLMAPVAVAGWLARTGTFGEQLVMIVWPLVWIFGLLAIAAAAVCGLGWLLSLGAIGTDQCSGSDALSRGINYVLSHKLRSFGLLFLVVCLACLASVVAEGLLAAVDRMVSSRMPGTFSPKNALFGDRVSSSWMMVWHATINHIQDAVKLGTFLVGTTIMYILLRTTEDDVQMRALDGAVTKS